MDQQKVLPAYELVAELNSIKCRCGKAKRSGMTFCTRCYYSLPKAMQRLLYNRVGHGYEEAYQAAVEELDGAAT